MKIQYDFSSFREALARCKEEDFLMWTLLDLKALENSQEQMNEISDIIIDFCDDLDAQEIVASDQDDFDYIFSLTGAVKRLEGVKFGNQTLGNIFSQMRKDITSGKLIPPEVYRKKNYVYKCYKDILLRWENSSSIKTLFEKYISWLSGGVTGLRDPFCKGPLPNGSVSVIFPDMGGLTMFFLTLDAAKEFLTQQPMDPFLLFCKEQDIWSEISI